MRALITALRYIIWFSAATPLSTILSSILVLFSSSYIPSSLLGYAFAFSAGTFLHVSLMHILPSIGSHVGFVQVGFILIGVLIPYLLFTEHSHWSLYIWLFVFNPEWFLLFCRKIWDTKRLFGSWKLLVGKEKEVIRLWKFQNQTKPNQTKLCERVNKIRAHCFAFAHWYLFE